jgi:hypothetical protein
VTEMNEIKVECGLILSGKWVGGGGG